MDPCRTTRHDDFCGHVIDVLEFSGYNNLMTNTNTDAISNLGWSLGGAGTAALLDRRSLITLRFPGTPEHNATLSAAERALIDAGLSEREAEPGSARKSAAAVFAWARIVAERADAAIARAQATRPA